MKYLQSEFLKYKRTLTWKLVVFIPVFFAAYAVAVQAALMDNPLARTNSWMWKSLLTLIFNWWPLVFLPLGFALFASLVASQEKKSGNYRALRAHDVSPVIIWGSKVITMAVISLLSTLVLTVSAITAGLLSKAGAVPFRQIVTAAMICWVTSLALIPIQLWAAAWKGIFLSMGIGFAGMTAQILTSAKPFWIAVPWSWPMRLMCPVLGIHPNGTALEPTDVLLDPSVIPMGIVISLVIFAAATALTAVWFKRRENI